MPKYLIGAEEEFEETRKRFNNECFSEYFTWKADGVLKDMLKKEIDWNKILANWEYSYNKEFVKLFHYVPD